MHARAKCKPVSLGRARVACKVYSGVLHPLARSPTYIIFPTCRRCARARYTYSPPPGYHGAPNKLGLTPLPQPAHHSIFGCSIRGRLNSPLRVLSIIIIISIIVMSFFVDIVSEDAFFENLTLGVSRQLEASPCVRNVQLERRGACDRASLSTWEQKHCCLLTEDLRNFYTSTDGFLLTWSLDIAGDDVGGSVLGLGWEVLQEFLNLLQGNEIIVVG